jgi:hypothetical protein
MGRVTKEQKQRIMSLSCLRLIWSCWSLLASLDVGRDPCFVYEHPLDGIRLLSLHGRTMTVTVMIMMMGRVGLQWWSGSLTYTESESDTGWERTAYKSPNWCISFQDLLYGTPVLYSRSPVSYANTEISNHRSPMQRRPISIFQWYWTPQMFLFMICWWDFRFSRRRVQRWLSSGMLRCAVWWILTDVSNVLNGLITEAANTSETSVHLPDHPGQHPIRQPSSYNLFFAVTKWRLWRRWCLQIWQYYSNLDRWKKSTKNVRTVLGPLSFGLSPLP